MTKPPTHTLPADAFRADRGTTDTARTVYVEPPEQVTRRDPGSDHDTIELRISRLESWMRSEIFDRTAMDDPDPEPVTVPVIPEGWELRNITQSPHTDRYVVTLCHDSGEIVHRLADEWLDALTAAIDAAKENDA